MKAKLIPKIKDTERFISLIKVNRNGCWDWKGYIKPSGYGIFSYRGFQYRAHRISYSIFKTELNIDLVLDHICMNKCCVNPKHLREVSRHINNIENSNAMAAINKVKTHCKNGHKFSKDNTYLEPKTKWRHCKICRYNIEQKRQR